MSIYLSPEDLFRLTGRRRYSAQRKALDALGIRYIRAASGEPLVRADATEKSTAERQNGPRWDRLNAA